MGWEGAFFALESLVTDVRQLVAPGDIAIYGTLCALATFQRSQIKSRILENSHFGAFIEQESYIRELIEAYMNSNFKTVLQILSRYSVSCANFPSDGNLCILFRRDMPSISIWHHMYMISRRSSQTERWFYTSSPSKRSSWKEWLAHLDGLLSRLRLM